MPGQNKAWRKRRSAVWQKQKARYYKQFEAGAHNGYQRYTTREDTMIINKEYPDRVITGKILRTVKAIRVRRSRLKRKA